MNKFSKKAQVGRKRQPSLLTLRNKCDALLSPLMIGRHPKCLLCEKRTQVAHHHVHKSKSNRLRYELDNLIPLCNSCHFKLHQNESYWASKVVEIRGMKWFKKIDTLKNEIIKTDRAFYITNMALLSQVKEKAA